MKTARILKCVVYIFKLQICVPVLKTNPRINSPYLLGDKRSMSTLSTINSNEDGLC